MTSTHKILAVDDDPSICKLVAVTLRNRGFDVLTANSGTEALAIAAVERPDLVVLDIMMPGMDGKEVRRRLAADARTKDIPILHLSAVGEFEGQLEALDAGMVDFMTKPFKPSELADKVTQFLDPAQREALMRERKSKTAKLRTIVDIMHRERD